MPCEAPRVRGVYRDEISAILPKVPRYRRQRGAEGAARSGRVPAPGRRNNSGRLPGASRSGGESENRVEDNRKEDNSGEETRKPKPGSYLTAAFVNVILLIVVTRVSGWEISFLTDKFSRVLWAFYLYLGVQVAGSLVMSRYGTRELHTQLDIAYRGLSGLVTLVLLLVFPFDFSTLDLAWVAVVVRVLLVLIFAGTVFGALRQLRRLSQMRREPE